MPLDLNRYVGSEEVPTLLARIDEAERALGALRTQHDRAEEARRTAEARVRAMEEQLNGYKALLNDAAAFSDETRRQYEAQLDIIRVQRAFFHPIRKLPPELLGYIFELCAEGRPPIYVHAIFPPHWQLQPFLLAAVCRRWRYACIGQARIWAYLDVILTKVTLQREANWLAYVDLLLSRARSIPLTIRITRMGPASALRRSLTTRLTKEMHRCKELVLNISHFRPGDDILSLLTVRETPWLKSAVINIQDSWALSDNAASFHLFPGARDLELYLSPSSYTVGRTIFPPLRLLNLRQTSSLDEDDTRDDLEPALRSSPNLESLCLRNPVVSLGQSAHTRIKLPLLKELILDDVPADRDLEPLLAQVDLSSIVELSLFGDEPADCRLQFLRAVAPISALATLHLSAISGASFQPFVDALPSLAQLAELYIYETSVTSANLAALCVALDAPDDPLRRWTCPSLTSVILEEDCLLDEDCKPDELLAMLRRRLAASCDRTLAARPALIRCFSMESWLGDTFSTTQADIDAVLAAADKDYGST